MLQCSLYEQLQNLDSGLYRRSSTPLSMWNKKSSRKRFHTAGVGREPSSEFGKWQQDSCSSGRRTDCSIEEMPPSANFVVLKNRCTVREIPVWHIRRHIGEECQVSDSKKLHTPYIVALQQYRKSKNSEVATADSNWAPVELASEGDVLVLQLERHF